MVLSKNGSPKVTKIGSQARFSRVPFKRRVFLTIWPKITKIDVFGGPKMSIFDQNGHPGQIYSTFKGTFWTHLRTLDLGPPKVGFWTILTTFGQTSKFNRRLKALSEPIWGPQNTRFWDILDLSWPHESPLNVEWICQICQKCPKMTKIDDFGPNSSILGFWPKQLFCQNDPNWPKSGF